MQPDQDESTQVYKTFSGTIYGKRLAEKARYDRFRPGWYPVRNWERLLGPDVNNLHHMRRSIEVARWFVKYENSKGRRAFSRRESVLLYVTAALHDQAEVIVGDIPYGRKSVDQRQWEIDTLKKYEAAFAPRLRGPALRLYRIGRDRIAFGDTTDRLAAAFKTIELIGFMHNALDSQQRLQQLKGTLDSRQKLYLGIPGKAEQDELRITLERLNAEVLSSGVIGKLIDLGAQFPSAYVFLRRHHSQISADMASVTMNIFDWHAVGSDPAAVKGDVERHVRRFGEQKVIWEQWLATLKD